MRYISTRGGMTPQTFSDILLMGLAPDGGLTLPEVYPKVTPETLAYWRTLSYAELAFEILHLFAPEIPADTLRTLMQKTYTANVFGSTDITPIHSLNDGLMILELSNGPTLAFKDMAMQCLGHLFEYILEQKGASLNILGATSGDTGSAAEYAVKGKKNIHIFMLSPNGRMSAFQRAQMYSLQDNNVHNIAINGMFDDCQDIVKAVQEDATFKARYHIGTVNSINWARVAAQVVYYFKGYFAATEHNQQPVSFCVPSGNFGNVCAGHIARQMGLPIARLVVATNENDILDEFFRTGHYQPRRQAHVTSSPSMDISKASNFERLIFDALDRDANQVQALWQHIQQGNGFNLSSAQRARIQHDFGFVSGSSSHTQRLATIRQVDQEDGRVIDPHTADGINVARRVRQHGETMICLETALPAKFAETINEALHHEPPRPASLATLEQLPQKVTVLPADVQQVKTLIANTLRGQV